MIKEQKAENGHERRNLPSGDGQLQRGYLNEPYRIFHLNGAPKKEVPFHYHEFFKLLALLDGKIGYEIEGRHYELMPGDLVLVRPGEIHRPVVHAREAYERIILYLSDEFLQPFPRLLESGERQVLRPGAEHPGERQSELCGALRRLPFASDASCGAFENGMLLQRSRLTEFLVLLDESMKEQAGDLRPVSQNENVRRAIDYIGAHIVEELSVDVIAEAVHVSRSHLMHIFRAETGYTLREFITEKRLFIASNLMRRGLPLTEVCYRSGFGNYSGFYRAYVRRFGASPRKKGQTAGTWYDPAVQAE